MTQPWWQGATIYEIYIRSFFDSNGDGVGDLYGITSKLRYIQKLGVDAIWITPFFRSPMKDFGYDVEDYESVAEEFGSIDDFDYLVRKAHELGLKVLIDQVWGHTSMAHPWFRKSRRSGLNQKADWYVWHDARKDGSPPNNWFSFFGGAAWEWDATREQYYLHHFLASQPALNLHHPDVLEELLEVGRFWLDRGVDGFRLDAVPFYMHDPTFKNNPPRPPGEPAPDGFSPNLPSVRQVQKHNIAHPDLLEILTEIRKVTDEYADRVLLGEVAGEHSVQLAANYTGPKKLHMAYNFGLLKTCSQPADIVRLIRSTIAEAPKDALENGRICWAIGNHDVARVFTRWGGEHISDGHQQQAFNKLVAAVQLSLPGSACIYQGEELGLAQVDLPFRQLKDPYDRSLYPNHQGRDGCRTPMPWKRESANCGFTSPNHQPWLPISEEHYDSAISTQDGGGNAGSILNAYRRFLHWRKSLPVMKYGGIRLVPISNKDGAGDSVLVYLRFIKNEGILLLFNFSHNSTFIRIECDALPQQFRANKYLKEIRTYDFQWDFQGGGVRLDPFGLGIVSLPNSDKIKAHAQWQPSGSEDGSS
ncbi:MAG: alpha-amylase family glycosyl hydrolase [Synechococcus sp.]